MKAGPRQRMLLTYLFHVSSYLLRLFSICFLKRYDVCRKCKEDFKIEEDSVGTHQVFYGN